jgi:Na+/H+ antiporter NhaD/arsenite permease-like protein
MQPAKALTIFSALPFVGLILSIALGPVLKAQWWHKHYVKVLCFWIILSFSLVAQQAGSSFLKTSIAHTVFMDYIPFICMIFALYVTAGGIFVDFKGNATLLNNVLLMMFGVVLANFLGTTGASMLLIRPLLNLNHERHYKRHLVIFFIFIVSNIGGCLTPVGDPPLFIGYLNGVDFFWTVIHLAKPAVLVLIPLFLVMIAVDSYFRTKEPFQDVRTKHPKKLDIQLKGGKNFLFIILIPLVIILGSFTPVGLSITVFDTSIKLMPIFRDVGLIVIGVLSYKTTNIEIHRENHFNFDAFKEVAWIFVAIFLTLIPVIAVLNLKMDGFFQPLLSVVNPNGVSNPILYFWLTGLLSGFLDNAPTYYVFFHLAGGDAASLMGEKAVVLTALSCGAVFFGALTYIGNAPNFMVYALAKQKGIPMPSFVGYMLWSFAVLLPIFALLSWLLF